MTQVAEPRIDIHDIARRPLVPTERQRQDGADYVAPEMFDPVPSAGERSDQPQKAPLRTRLAGYAGALDPRSIKGAKLPLFVFAALALLGNIDDSVFALVLPELRAEFGGDLGPLILAGTVSNILITLSGPVFGYLIDRVKRVRLVRISQIGTGLAGLGAPLFANSILSVTMYRGAAGLVGGMAGPGSAAPASLLPDYYDVEDYSRALVFLPAMTALGGVLTPLIAGYTIEASGGWRPAAILLGVIATVIAASSLLLREPKRGGVQVASVGAQVIAGKPPTLSESLRTLRGIYTLRRLWVAVVPLGAVAIGVQVFLALYWAQVFGLTPSERSFLLSLSSGTQFVLMLALTPLLGKIAARRPNRIFVYLGIVVALCSIFALVLAFSRNLTLSIMMSLPLTAGIATLLPSVSLLLVRIVPADVRGLGVTSIQPSLLAGQLLFTILSVSVGKSLAGVGHLALMFVPLCLIAGYLLASAARGVDKDIRTADAMTLARLAFHPDAGNSADEAFLVCRDVEVQYSGSVILAGVDLDVRTGEMLALLGTNGAGKSTLLKVISGLVPASNGAIFYQGRNITYEPPHLNVRAGLVMVPGGRAVFPTMSVRDNLATALVGAGPEASGETGFEEVLELFPVLRERLDQRAGDLSGGEQQMVALSQALLMRPNLLMIDELSLGLAPAVVEQLLDVLTLINSRGTTVIIVEQSVNVALTVAKRAVFLDKGQIQFDGPTEDLLARPDLVRSVFMGGAATGTPVGHRSAGGLQELAEVLHVEELAVDFGGVRAVDGVSLSVTASEILGILGPNGAGKTTLFDAISGFVRTSSGRVVLDGTDVSSFSPDARANLGLVRSFQDARLFPSMTVRDNIAVAFQRLASRNVLGAIVWAPAVRRNEERVRRRVDGLIDLLNLGPYADLLLGELSTGSRRAVDVAVVMAAEPKVLLLDEPSSGLAQVEVEALGPVISRLARETGSAVIVIEHDLPLLGSVSDRLLAMERGRTIASGLPHDVLSDPAVMASYLNASESVLARSGTPMSTIAAALGVTAEPPTEVGKP
jgi:ABC-type branched-subunit amino acid transport system ATPase component